MSSISTHTLSSVIRGDNLGCEERCNIATLEWMGTFDPVTYDCYHALSMCVSLSYVLSVSGDQDQFTEWYWLWGEKNQ